MIDHYRRLFAYDAWANRESLRSLEGSTPRPARAIEILAHVLSCQVLWYERIISKPQSLPVWPDLRLERACAEIERLATLWPGYLDTRSEDDLGDAVAYVNTKGERFEDSIADILTHVILHSTYHRGQIASLLRNSGVTPALTDFIHGVRTRAIHR